MVSRGLVIRQQLYRASVESPLPSWRFLQHLLSPSPNTELQSLAVRDSEVGIPTSACAHVRLKVGVSFSGSYRIVDYDERSLAHSRLYQL